MDYIVGVDIGGTFTDCVVVDDEGAVTVGKAPSTPADFSLGVVDALHDVAEKLGLRDEQGLIPSISRFIHACTVGENALITRSGATTGLITTKGFGDTLLIMRGQVREGLTESEAVHLSALDKPEPLVPRPLIEEVTERVDYEGSILLKLDLAEAEEAINRLINKGVESVAICLLWSTSNDAHEKSLAEVLRSNHPSIFVTISSEVAPYLGEYERTATTVFNAYIGPKISTYLQGLRKSLSREGLSREPLIMQAYGGVLGVDATCTNAVGTIESGPAAGVVGSKSFGDLTGDSNILATDMGGTTFKVSVIRDGIIERDHAPLFMRHRILSPKIWVESIGAGGGSIAWIDSEMGLLKVGPQGAGARPGPVCYALGGTEPTVSDADLALGYLNENYFLGGRMALDKAASLKALEEMIAKPLGMDVIEAARGIYDITNAHMSDLIRRATVERGHDPRNFVLFAYGGAGPVHASRYAAELGVKKVVIPITASVHGATGLISSDMVYQYSKPDRLMVPADEHRVNANFSAMCAQAFDDLHTAGFDDQVIRVVRSIDMRYRYQVHELSVPFPEGTSEITEEDLEELNARFDELYEKSYGQGSGYAEAGREMVTFRVDAIGELRKPVIKKQRAGGKGPDHALKETRDVYFEENRGFRPTNIYDFERLGPGNEIAGPAVIETPVTTIVINPKDRAIVDEFRNVAIHVGA